MRFAFLSDKFYEDYPANRYPEIEQKRNRPYVVVFITIGERIFAIPMRSHIRHPHAYLTDKVNQCGVDYTKAVVIIDEQKYIDSVKQPHIRPNEFDALRGKEYRIQCGMQKYIEKYKKAKLSEKETDKILVRCSTLQYFEEYLWVKRPTPQSIWSFALSAFLSQVKKLVQQSNNIFAICNSTLLLLH